MEKKGEKSEKRRTRGRPSIFIYNQVRVRLTFNIIKSMILKDGFTMIRLSFVRIDELGFEGV